LDLGESFFSQGVCRDLVLIKNIHFIKEVNRMLLIAILICLTLQRFANIGGVFQTSWFAMYLKALKPWIGKLNKWVAVLLIVMPILLLLMVLQLLLAEKLFGLVHLILSTLVLFFCIDSRDFKNKLAGYFVSLEKGDVHAAADAAAAFVGDVSSSELNRAVTKSILLGSFERLFAGLFWFMVFGGYGAAAYFLVALLRQSAFKVDSNYDGLAKAAAQIQDVLDWIPSRLVGISYSLVGNFRKGFKCCSKHLWTGLAETRNFSVDVGIAALGANSDETKATLKENHAALDLINHTLVIWIIALAFVLLGVWL
jgi:membrane protein required for beta-lactamase induction